MLSSIATLPLMMLSSLREGIKRDVSAFRTFAGPASPDSFTPSGPEPAAPMSFWNPFTGF